MKSSQAKSTGKQILEASYGEGLKCCPALLNVLHSKAGRQVFVKKLELKIFHLGVP